MEVFALAMLTKTSALGEKKRDTPPKHPHSLPSKPHHEGFFLPRHKHFISFPTQAICFLNHGSLSLFFLHFQPNRINLKRWDHYKQNSAVCLYQQQYRNVILNTELIRGELDGSYLSLTAQPNLIYSLAFIPAHREEMCLSKCV